MLVTLLIWAYLTGIFLAYGVGTFTFFRRWLPLQPPASIPASVIVLCGLAFLAWLASVFSLLMKVGLVVHLFVLAGALLIVFFQIREIKSLAALAFKPKHWAVWILAGLCFLTTLLYAVKIPGNPDTPLYHAQAIHWIEQYPAVPGLGNLEPRLGANSNWFTFVALFSFSFLGGQSFHLIPSFLFLVCVIYFAGGFQHLLDGDLRLSQIIKLAFVPLVFYVLIDEVSSPGTDLPVILFYWLIMCLWLESIETRSALLQGVVFLFSVLVVTFKLSGIVILLVALQILYQLVMQKAYRLFGAYSAVAVLLLLPWMLRTFILTGYWLYPEPAMQILSPQVDWMIPTDRVLAFKQGVQAWALASGTQWNEVASFSLIQKFGFWFSNLTLNQKGLTLLALISPVIFWLSSSLFQQKEAKSYTPVVLLSYMCFVFWLLSAPNYRFGYGFVLGLIVLSLAPLLQFVLEHAAKYRFYVIGAIVLVLSFQQVYVMLGSIRDHTRYTHYMILPANYRRVRTDPCTLDGRTISCAHSYRQCGYDAFPCVPQIPKKVELRGATFRDGFRRIP